MTFYLSGIHSGNLSDLLSDICSDILPEILPGKKPDTLSDLFFLANILRFYPVWRLTFYPTDCVAYILISYLRCILTYVLFWHFYVEYSLTFYMVASLVYDDCVYLTFLLTAILNFCGWFPAEFQARYRVRILGLRVQPDRESCNDVREVAGVRARGCPPRSRAHDSVRDLADARAHARPPKYGGRSDVRDLAQALIRVAEKDRKISRTCWNIQIWLICFNEVLCTNQSPSLVLYTPMTW